jgi:Holliday junction resolvasome RuvABC endonuclease subunit
MLRKRSVLPLRSAPPAAPAKRVLGIDPSLTSTGWAYREGDTVITGRIATDSLRGPWRLHYAVSRLEEIVRKARPDLVVYEDYAYNRGKGNKSMTGTFDMAELGGVFKRMLWHGGFDVVMVPPTVLKLFVTGKGGVRGQTAKEKKAMVMSHLYSDFGVRIHQHDEADAAGLMLLGEYRTGFPSIYFPALKSDRQAAAKNCPVVGGKLQTIAKTG